jgi:biotin carboxylase
VTRIVMIESNMSGSGFQALRLAAQMGIDVTFLTRDVGLYLAVPGVAEFFDHYVDEIIRCETNDVDSLVETVRSRMRRGPVDAVVALGEYHIAPTARAAHVLGFPGVNPEAVRLTRNKDATRATCRRTGVPAPRFQVVYTAAESLEAAETVGFPCVVKPADESGSIDVALCLGAPDVVAQFDSIRATPVNYRGQRRSPAVLVEEYVPGPEFSVETLSWNGQTHVVGVTDKQLAGCPRFVEVGHAFPSGATEEQVTACGTLAVQALAAVGHDFGPAHVEVKFGAAGPRLIEINPRAGGDRIPDLVELASGVSLIRETLRMHLGDAPDLSPSRHRGAAIRFLAAEPGVVRSVAGVDIARSLPGVTDIGLEVSIGDTVRPLRNAHDRVAYAIAHAQTTYQATRRAETALAQILISTSPQVSCLAS